MSTVSISCTAAALDNRNKGHRGHKTETAAETTIRLFCSCHNACRLPSNCTMASSSYNILVVAILLAMARLTFSTNFTATELPKRKPSFWPHKSVFVQAGSGMTAAGMDRSDPLPLGVPFDIETPLFKGRVLLRFRSTKSDDPKSHSEYFEGRKRLMQTVIQVRYRAVAVFCLQIHLSTHVRTCTFTLKTGPIQESHQDVRRVRWKPLCQSPRWKATRDYGQNHGRSH